MAATYGMNLATRKDYARSLLGDTDVSTAANVLFQDEEYSSAFGKGFVPGLRSLVVSAISKAGREASNYSQGAGAGSASWANRLPALRELLSQIDSGMIADPEAAQVNTSTFAVGLIKSPDLTKVRFD